MKIIILIVIWLFPLYLFSQGKPYQGPDDPAGDKAAERKAYMDGNRVMLYFQNTSEMGKWIPGIGEPLWSKWPNDQMGTRMLDGMAFMVGARIYMMNDTIPVNPANVPGADLDTLYYLQTSYQEMMDTNPMGTVEWGFYPVFGYFNESGESVAMSNNPQSWPTEGWPAAGDTKIWPGEWNGRFGRGVFYADLETYYVINDAQDQEYLGFEDKIKYYPRPGIYIGDKKPDVSIQYGSPWGGIGARVEVRGFQWNKEEARDIIFWEYKIANISDYDIYDMAVGFWVDNGIGGEASDELNFFNSQIDLVYSWDIDGIGRDELQTGTMGFAFLETPAFPFDGLDNDSDGLIDESRDNQATQIVGPTDGIADVDKFLEFYKLSSGDLKSHWDADEDQDWRDGNDENNNGIYDNGEDPGDDIGLDGVGPYDANYNGPDVDGTECNHKPDYVQGFGCEPNFAATDISEGDMMGLSSFNIFPTQSQSSSYRWFRGDESMWELIGEQTVVAFLGNISNLIMTFSSGPFPLYQGREERISMAELHTYDDLAGLNSDNHEAPNLFALKHTSQRIYENDYRYGVSHKTVVTVDSGQTEIDDIENSQSSVLINANNRVNVSITSYKNNPLNSDDMAYSNVQGVGNYLSIEAGEGVQWPCEIKIYYTQQDLTQSNVSENDLEGIFYWNNISGLWRLYSDTEDTSDVSTTGVNTENTIINDTEYEGYVWALVYHFTPIRIGLKKPSALYDEPDFNPASFHVYQNYPNPFNPSTKIKFNLPQKELVRITIYNALGQKVFVALNSNMEAGLHTIEFTDSKLASGVYFYKVQAGKFVSVKKMLLFK